MPQVIVQSTPIDNNTSQARIKAISRQLNSKSGTGAAQHSSLPQIQEAWRLPIPAQLTSKKETKNDVSFVSLGILTYMGTQHILTSILPKPDHHVAKADLNLPKHCLKIIKTQHFVRQNSVLHIFYFCIPDF